MSEPGANVSSVRTNVRILSISDSRPRLKGTHSSAGLASTPGPADGSTGRAAPGESPSSAIGRPVGSSDYGRHWDSIGVSLGRSKVRSAGGARILGRGDGMVERAEVSRVEWSGSASRCLAGRSGIARRNLRRVCPGGGRRRMATPPDQRLAGSYAQHRQGERHDHPDEHDRTDEPGLGTQ